MVPGSSGSCLDVRAPLLPMVFVNQQQRQLYVLQADGAPALSKVPAALRLDFTTPCSVTPHLLPADSTLLGQKRPCMFSTPPPHTSAV